MSHTFKILGLATVLTMGSFQFGNAQRMLIDDFESNLDAWTVVDGNMSLSTNQSLSGSQSLEMNEPYTGNNMPVHILEHNTFRDNFGRYEYNFYCNGEASDADLYFQYVDENHYYKVSCKPAGTDNPELIFCKGTPQGEFVLHWEEPTFGLNEWFKISVERFCDGHTHVWVNDDLRVDVTDLENLERGTIRLRGWADITYIDDVYFEPFQNAEIPISLDTICQDDSLQIGTKFERETGIYFDTLSPPNQFCVDVAEVNLTVLPPDTLNLIADLCPGDSAWIGDGYTQTSGFYSFLQEDDGCGELSIYEVIAQDSSEIQDSFELCPGTEIEISPGDFPQYSWETGSSDPSIPVTTTGTFEVEILDGFCNRVVQIDVFSDCSDNVYIPNAFTPNGDGVNDHFGLATEAAGEYELMIFDRWGNMVYHANVSDEGWDGNVGAEAASTGVYVYHITWNETLLSGSLSLLR